MLEQRLPFELSYPTILPKGFPSIYKQWQLDPMSSNKQWTNYDIVRFQPQNMGRGVFDPFKSYIQITVTTDANSHPVGLLQVDSSAQSFIAQFVLYSNNRQVQRITQYSTLSSYLTDVGLDQYISQGRETQGYGYGSFDTMPTSRSPNMPQVTVRGGSKVVNGMSCSPQTTFPTIGSVFPQSTQVVGWNSVVNAASTAKGHATNSNIIQCGTSLVNAGYQYPQQTVLAASMKIKGYANNIRGQYLSKYVQNKFPQSTSSIPTYELLLSPTLASTTNNLPMYQASLPYYTQVRNQLLQQLNFDGDITVNTHTISTANFGFSSLYCPYFTRGTFQPCISATVPQSMIQNGNILQTKVPLYRRKFKIPVISGVIGVLIPQDILIPLSAISSSLIEITLDPYAMFTSGYSDYCEIDTVGMGVAQKRNYNIERISYKIQTYHFLDSQIQQYLDTSLYRQINVITNFWSLSNQFQIPGGTPPNNNYIIGCNSMYLNQFVALFVPNDYQKWSHCRRHYRISNNITKFWIKIGIQYWPPQPYKGNGGNPQSNQFDDDNSIYIQNIYWSCGSMFARTPLPRINAYNFSLNQRPYNPANTSTFYDPSLLNNLNYAYTSSSVNADTALGMSWIHQNRCVGKAAYVCSFNPFRNTQNLLNGINVSQINNLQAVFEANSQYTFPRDQTLYMFTRSSGTVKYTKEGIKTYGR